MPQFFQSIKFNNPSAEGPSLGKAALSPCALRINRQNPVPMLNRGKCS